MQCQYRLYIIQKCLRPQLTSGWDGLQCKHDCDMFDSILTRPSGSYTHVERWIITATLPQTHIPRCIALYTYNTPVVSHKRRQEQYVWEQQKNERRPHPNGSWETVSRIERERRHDNVVWLGRPDGHKRGSAHAHLSVLINAISTAPCVSQRVHYIWDNQQDSTG